MLLTAFDYHLPPQLIAQKPASPRDHSRLLYIDRTNSQISHHHFYELPKLLDRNSILVFNNSKVIKARLHGLIDNKKVELLLFKKLPPTEKNIWQSLVKPGRQFQIGKDIQFISQKKTNLEIKAKILNINPDGSRIIIFHKLPYTFSHFLKTFGSVPLPPYIKNNSISENKYQTVFAKKSGSIAAPTAGLHFTPRLLKKLRKNSIKSYFLTLHVGLGTFQEVRSTRIEDHTMSPETYHIDLATASALNQAKKNGKKIIAVGTTAARSLESAANQKNHLQSSSYWHQTELFIYPGYKFRFVDGLITNFHLPKTTLLMLVSALAGSKTIKQAYQEAIHQHYRFFSFGDAMMIK